MKYKTLTALLLLVPAVFVKAQNADSLIKNACDDLMVVLTGNAKNNCLYNNTGEVSSCFKVTGKPEWITDFDKDGEKDLLLHISIENKDSDTDISDDEYVAVIMKNGKISETHSIPGGGESAEGTLEINKVDKGLIYATYAENPNNSINSRYAPLQKIALTFEYQNGQMTEQSYARCPLADMDKRVFNYDTPYIVKRDAVLNEHYENEQIETLYFESKEDYITASFYGCKNIYIDFSYDIPYTASLEQNGAAREEALINLLRFLQENTRFTSVLSLLIKKVENTDEFTETNEALLDMSYSLPDNWVAKILIDKFGTAEGTDEIGFTISLNKYTDKDHTGFWNEMKR